MVKTSRISRLEVVCKKNSYVFVPPAIELIYIVEKHNTLITINFRDVEMAARCGEMEFNIDGGEGDERVENVPTFQYMGRLLDQTDDDWTDVWQNIMHARSVWGRLGTLI